MPIYLNEDQTGTDPQTIAYPHLLLCMGVTVLMSDGSLIGGHYTIPHTENAVSQGIQNLVTANGGNMVRMYMTGNFQEHCANFGGQSYQGKANLIGYQGTVYCFDTAKIAPANGTFVRVTSHGAGSACRVEYKREEKVQYTDSHGTTGRVGNYQNQPNIGLVSANEITAVATVTGGPIHKCKFWSFDTHTV